MPVWVEPPAVYSEAQAQTILRLCWYAEKYGMTEDQRAEFMRIAWRESNFLPVENWLGCVGVFQWCVGGVFQVTPAFAYLGYDGRWRPEHDIGMAAWAFTHGYKSHWQPGLRVNWLRRVPAC